MKGYAGGHLGGAGSATTAATAREGIPRLTAPFPAQLDFVPAPPPLGEEGDNTDGQGTPNVVSVHSFNNLIVLPSQQTGLPQLANLFCPVPVSVLVSVPVSVPASVPVSVPATPCITAVSFAPLYPVSKVSPLQLDQFQAELRHHPDESAVAYVISGIQDGFRIGFDPSLVSLKSASSNMRSSSEHPSVIDSYLQNEVSSSRVAGPFPVPPLPSLHISCFGVILKIISLGSGVSFWTSPHLRGKT